MGLYKIPIAVIQHIEKIKRQFFWVEISNKDSYKRKLHIIRWEMIIRDGSTCITWKIRLYSKMAMEGENRKGKTVVQIIDNKI